MCVEPMHALQGFVSMMLQEGQRYAFANFITSPEAAGCAGVRGCEKERGWGLGRVEWGRSGGWTRVLPAGRATPTSNSLISDPLQKGVDSLFVFVVKIVFLVNLKGGPLQEPK